MKKRNKSVPDASEVEVFVGSGNVFADLGLPNPEERLLKAQVAAQIQKLMTEKQLTQVQLAELVGLDQPKVSKLLRGQLSGYSLERLFSILNKLGRKIEIRVSSTEYAPEDAHTSILVA
jgi:predicted XRE-type DNA-binding protein